MTRAVRLAMLVFLLLPGQTMAQDGNPNQFVVFVHAGPRLSDPKIKQITGALFEKGYQVRAPDNDQDTEAGAGVDYFDKSAEKTALDIAKLMNEKLESLGLKTAADLELKPRFQKVKNPPTYIGVWLFGKGPG